MPKSGTWPGSVAMETLSSMDSSAGSCDSVISANSAFSDDSMEHLSPEERACLMFLEETIESLELEEDSGVSNDELDGGQHDAQGFQHDETGHDQKSFLSGGVPTPFLLANSLPETPDEPTEPTSAASSIEHSAPPHEHADPQTSADADDANAPTTAPTTGQTSPELQTQDADPATDTRTPSPAATSTPSDSDTGVVDRDEGTEKDAQPGGHSSEMDMGLILPPSDFRDEPATPQPEPEHPKDQELLGSLGTSQRSSITPTDMEDQAVKTPSPVSSPVSTDPPSKPVEVPVSGHAPSSLPEMPQTSPPIEAVEIKSSGDQKQRSSITPADMEDLGRQAVKTPSPVSSPVSLEPPSEPPVEVPVSGHAPSSLPEMPQPSPPLEAVEIKSPPAVAPRPKKLPSNIILKSHKPPAGSSGNPAHPVSSSSDRLIQLDPQRVRMEALRKLGLLKSEERVPGPPVLSPNKLSRGSRKSWAAPSAPLSPPYVPTSTPSPPPVPTINPPPASVTVTVPSPVPGTAPPPTVEASLADPIPDPAVRDANILPAPAAFSDTVEPLVPPTDTPPVPAVPPASPKNKSATLERSGKSESTGGGATNAQRCPSEVRNTRARPASLGSGKDFSEAQGGYQVSPHLAGDLQKLPRSHGISVVICPRAKNGEDRREALKKLGLLRD